MKIGLYFGSFNPVHIGHCIIASHFVQNTDLERVWMVVSPQNPFKESSSLLNEYHRLHLVKLATENETKLKASDIEFHLPHRIVKWRETLITAARCLSGGGIRF